jgi:uncharacterized membrane protein
MGRSPVIRWGLGSGLVLGGSLLLSGVLLGLDGGWMGRPGQLAIARSSGGRSRGGSFTPSSPSRSSSPSSPSRSRSGNSSGGSSGGSSVGPRSQPSYGGGGYGGGGYGGGGYGGGYPQSMPIPIPIPMPNQYPDYGYPQRGYPNQTYPDPIDPNPTYPDSSDPFRGAVPGNPVTRPGTIPANPPATIPAQTAVTPDYTWLLVPAGAVAIGGGLFWYSRRQRSVVPGSVEELTNNVMTVSAVQLALLANAPIQAQLAQIVKTMPIDDQAQLNDQLQAVAMALLRLPEYWCYAKISSQTYPTRGEAESSFEQWSMRTRSLLSEETLTRDSFGLREQAIAPPGADEDPAAYVVVTLLVGTTHDQPLFESTVHEGAEVKTRLEKLASLRRDELLVFEFVWSPQDAADSLTREELLSEYSDLAML